MKRSTIHSLAIFAAIVTLLQMSLGAYTRGDGVDDVVPWTGALIGLVVITVVYASLRLGLDRRWVVLPSVGAVVAVGVQAWLGWIHSGGESVRELVVIHLFVSLILLGLLVIIAVTTRAAPDGPNLLERDWSRELAVGTFAVFIVLMLGSMIGQSDFSASIYWAHRMASAAVLVYLIFLVWRGAHVERPHAEGYLVIGATVLFVGNAVLGFFQAAADVAPDWAPALHLGLGAALWAALVGATFLSFHDPR